MMCSTFDAKSVKVPGDDVDGGLDCAGGDGGQSVPLSAGEHQLGVLQLVRSSQEMLRYRVRQIS